MRANRIRISARNLLGAVLVGVWVACDAPTVTPDAPYSRSALVPTELHGVPGIDRLRDVPARSVEVPREPRPWDLSASSLEAVLAEGDGHATVAFKGPGSTRISANVSGRAVRQALTTEDAEAGLLLLRSRGVQVLRYNAIIGGAHVVFSPGVGSLLRESDRIDYIEPRHVWYRPGGPPRLRPLRGEQPPQTSPIGLEAVRAALVWNSYTGAEVHVGIIDDGYDRGHADLMRSRRASAGTAHRTRAILAGTAPSWPECLPP
jgi:hypothetical protein